MSELLVPSGWIACELNELGSIVTGKTPSTKESDNFGGPIPFIKPGDLDDGGYIISTVDTLTEKGLGLVPSLPKNSLTVTCIGNLGKVGITTQTSATNQQINSVIPSSFLNYNFLYHQLCTLKPWLESEASATTVAIINKGKFSKAPIFVAPLAEQKVIADKLDTLLAQVESIKARLERIPEILKQFRQSVLAAAVSGKLTEAWRDGQHLTIWESVALEAIADIKDPHPSHRTPSIVEGGVPYIGIGDLKNDGSIDFENARKVSYDVLAEHQQRYQLKEGDFVFGKIGTLGKATELPIGIEYTLSANVILIQPDIEKVIPKFLMSFMSAPDTMDKIAQQANSTSQAAFGIKKMRVFETLLPPLSEQNEIISRLEVLEKYTDAIEQQVQSALDRVNNLTQSILAKAFRGELTADWCEAHPELISGVNSAEALLERIKVERSATLIKRSRSKA